MSSDFPPQLQLRLPPSTTSFKRSFEEFGFDLPSPSGSESTGSTSNGNERNKRPRSASSHSDNGNLSQSSSASSSSTSYSSSSQNSLTAAARSALSATRPSSSSVTNDIHPISSSSRPFHEIPVLPNPTIQDVDMLGFLAPNAQNTQSSRSSPAASPPVSQPNEQLRLSLERFNTFDTEISALRRSHSISPLVPRTTTPPPTLPPLMLSDDQPDLSAAALPYLHHAHRTDALQSHSHGTEGSLAGSSRARRVDMLNRGDVHPRIPDSRPFQFDLHIDPRLQSSQRSQNSLSLASPEDSPIHVSSESWEQTTPTAGDSTMSGLEFASIRDRLDSALEPLRSASPLVPGLVEHRSSPPVPPRPSRTNAPTLPPLRTQLQQPSTWDDLSYRMLFFGPSASTTNTHGREALVNENRSPPTNTSVRNPLSYWNEATYGISERLNASSIAGDRDREPVPHDLLSPPEHSGNALGIQTTEPFQSQNAPMYEELDVDPIPPLEGQRNPSQQLPSSSTESLSRSSLDGYVSSEDWLPMLRRRSAWRVLDSDEEERLSAEARRMRLLAEQRETSRTSRPGLTSASSDSTTPWLNFVGERRRSTSNRPPSSALRPAPSSDRHVSISTPFDGVHFWDDTDSDRMSGHTAESDTWAGTEHYPRSTRADISQRLERLADDNTHGYESSRPSLLRSNTSASTLAAFNRLRNRLYHSSSTRLASSSSLVTENSFEFRRRSARQEWMERWSRLNDERAQNQSEPRPSRPIVPDTSASGEPRRPDLRINTRMPLDRRLFGSADGMEEARRAPEADAFGFQNDNLLDRFASLPRPMQWEYRPIQRPSSPAQSNSTRSSLNAPLPPGQWEYRPIQRSSSPAQLSSARASLNVSSAPGQWEYRPIPRPSSPAQSNSARASLNVSSAPGQWEYRPIPRPSSPAQSNSARPPASNVPPPPGLGTERYSRFLEYLHDYPDSSPIYPSPFNFGPIDVPHRSSEEPAVLRNARDSQGDWFSRRRHSARPSQSQIHASLWGDFDSADFGIDRPAEAGRPGVGEREREPSTAGLRSSLDRHTRIDEPPRISPVRPISPYLIDVPPLPSPDLSDLFDTVPHFSSNSTHEERLVSSRPVSELSSRIRRRSPSPAVRASQTRARLDRPGVVRSNTGFANIDPELFAPGPYRNTFQSLQRRREPSPPQPSQPPSIPPFAFEAGTDREVRSTRRHHSLYAESFDSRPSAQLRGESEAEPRPAHFWRSSSQSGRHYPRNDWDSASPALTPPDEHHRHREQPASSNDLHSFLSRHVRLEGARMERFAEAAQLSEASSNVSRFNHAIEVLRGDGLSRRQSVDRPSAGGRASSDAPRERSSLDWLAAHHHHTHGRPRRARARRVRPLGDYMRDEDFDESYESLLSLAAAIGDVKPRCTPEEVISKLETAMYKEWATPECDKRCPICLDDYSPSDTVMKVGDCAHWLHKDCLHQWLKSANTCPVCRMVVHSPRLRNSTRHYQRGESSSNSSDRREDSTSQINTSNMPSANSETNSFSARARFAGWPTTWRYYHP